MTPEEIVKRLRCKDRTRVIYNRAGVPANFKDDNDPDCLEAADLIDHLLTENARKDRALEDAEKALRSVIRSTDLSHEETMLLGETILNIRTARDESND